MAKIIVKNAREHDIILARVSEKGPVVTLTIPAALKVPDEKGGKDILQHGEAEVEDSELATVRKGNEVAESYFEEGALIIGKSAKVEAK